VGSIKDIEMKGAMLKIKTGNNYNMRFKQPVS